MILTRRDAIKAIVAGGIATGISTAPQWDEHFLATREPEKSLSQTELMTLSAIAEVVYPSEITPSEEFINTYFDYHTTDRLEKVNMALSDLNQESIRLAGDQFYNISKVTTRDALLKTLGVDKVQSNPTGSIPERIRYHLVNGLLFALFTSPKGSQLVGLEDPAGHPGGFATYNNPENGDSNDD